MRIDAISDLRRRAPTSPNAHGRLFLRKTISFQRAARHRDSENPRERIRQIIGYLLKSYEKMMSASKSASTDHLFARWPPEEERRRMYPRARAPRFPGSSSANPRIERRDIHGPVLAMPLRKPSHGSISGTSHQCPRERSL